MEKMGNLRRTDYSGNLREEDISREIVVAGSIAKTRDLGGVIFADLRDNSGIVQLAFDDATASELFEKAATLKTEYVVMVKGIVRARESINKTIKTGKIELYVNELRILSTAETTPFEIRDEIKVKDELRLKYRYLDLRREELHRTIVMRSKIGKLIRDYYCDHDFCEIETPMLIKSTPEGARDYLVPSRVQPGHFYALPQSPQLYKQLLMLSGFDRYFQIVRCFRDEDLRADRQPEFTQIDLEMAFAEEIDIQDMNEGLVKMLFKKILDVEVQTPFARMKYSEAMDRFGSDKPDTRFGLELTDVSEVVKNSEFVVFKSALEAGGSVRVINAKSLAEKMSRKDIDKLVDVAKTYGAKGLAYTRLTAESETSSFEKFLTDEEKLAFRKAANAETGDVILVVADAKNDTVFAALGALRLEIAKKYELIDEKQFNFLWVTEFPLFEYDEENNRFAAKHHPFTMPCEEDMGLLETDPAAVKARAYDMVLNGCEIGGGSIRINNPELQQRMFKALGFTDERAEENFGFLVDAYKFGAPPHGGMAFGFDRLVMLMLGKDSIRDVIAFPKVQNAGEPMTNCPDLVDNKQLAELSIKLDLKVEE